LPIPGLVELLAHEFLFNPEMQKTSDLKVLYYMGCMAVGAGGRFSFD
jgi:solute carrier family 39 (zinc transporter), member 1/2/3